MLGQLESVGCDMTALLGLVLGIAAVLATNMFVGDTIAALLKLDAAVIVFGGTAAALLVHATPRAILNAGRQFVWLIKPPSTDSIKLIQDIFEWSKIVRKSGFLALEPVAEELSDPFLKVGLDMLVSGKGTDELRDVLYQVGDVEDRENMQGGEVWEAAGGYAPTIGVLGAVLGLIHVMLRLSHPSELGGGIATAFVATVYGVGSANLMFFPLGNRLKSIAGSRTIYREIATEGILLLSNQNMNPLRLRERLENMLESRRRAGLEKETPSGEANTRAEAA